MAIALMKKLNNINRIVCAANKLPDGTLILGVRHCGEVMINIKEKLGTEDKVWWESEQGFVDKFGEFKSREEAWLIACEADQIIHLCGNQSEDDIGQDGVELFSENLY